MAVLLIHLSFTQTSGRLPENRQCLYSAIDVVVFSGKHVFTHLFLEGILGCNERTAAGRLKCGEERYSGEKAEVEQCRGGVKWCRGDVNTLKGERSKFLFKQGWLHWHSYNSFILSWEQLHLAQSFYLLLSFCDSLFQSVSLLFFHLSSFVWLFFFSLIVAFSPSPCVFVW